MCGNFAFLSVYDQTNLHLNHRPFFRRTSKSRWWFQLFFTMNQSVLGGGNNNIVGILTPTWGSIPFWPAYFSNGLVQPPTKRSQLPTSSPGVCFFCMSGELGFGREVREGDFYRVMQGWLIWDPYWGNQIYCQFEGFPWTHVHNSGLVT